MKKRYTSAFNELSSLAIISWFLRSFSILGIIGRMEKDHLEIIFKNIHPVVSINKSNE